MEWTEESISRLRTLWQEGLSTAEIGRRMQISKNAVVGKAHRLTLPPRPSPIRKNPEERAARGDSPRSRSVHPEMLTRPVAHSEPVRAEPARQSLAHTELPAPVRPETVHPAAAEPAPVAQRPDAAATSNVTAFPSVQALRPSVERSPLDALQVPPAREEAAPSPRAQEETPVRRSVASAAPRRRGLTCCWPLGEPGTKEFHFCGGDPIPGKPYCSEHASLAYVKLRDRRDSVA